MGRSMIAGRCIASIFNLVFNRQFVFKSQAEVLGIVLRYYSSMIVAGWVAYLLISFISSRLGWPVIVAKVAVESTLFFASFIVNRDFVFGAALSRPSALQALSGEQRN